MINKFKVLIAASVLFSAAAPAQSASIFREMKYYNINGKTAADLDYALSNKGPFLKSTGQHHPGAAEIRFDAKVRYGKEDGKACKVTGVYVNVHGKVFLPRWKQRKRAPLELAMIWDTLSSDIRRHEESHLVIARVHASEMEQTIARLYSRKDCADLRDDINRVTEKIMEKHDKEQQRFDRVETINFESRFERLLTYRLEQLADSL
ncbi:putative secreted Zn-dependent protease [Paenochrobactrum gallinarii]|uniref:Putative secreted Zn-dependent protease n=1 Tax=Paenochrobactrum gallinarii TaxID=643673 RepID=A0A841LTM7_9HYPH|nr:DUF922 domain-containing protein [Paenochrobactrum gallinarii]MBB6261615.1 putative secreted Zn-dependent protease [Paenochrobactrum gallinarii]